MKFKELRFFTLEELNKAIEEETWEFWDAIPTIGPLGQKQYTAIFAKPPERPRLGFETKHLEK